MSQFARTIGIDYSGAETPTSSLKGLRVYIASGGQPPVEVLPPPSNKKYWTRRGLAEWLVATLREDIPTIVGIDHAFSLPAALLRNAWSLAGLAEISGGFPAPLADR